MKLTCEMFWDLYPNYEENLVNDETKSIIREHLSHCDSCRRKVENLIQEDRYLGENVPSNLFEKKSFKKKFKRFNRNMWIDLVVIVACILIIAVSVLYIKREEIWVMCLTGRLELVEEAKARDRSASVYYEKKTGEYWIEAPNLHIIDCVKYDLYWNEQGNELAMFYKKDDYFRIYIDVYEGKHRGGYSFRLEKTSVRDAFSQELGEMREGTESLIFDGFINDSTYQLLLQLEDTSGKIHERVMQVNFVTSEINFLAENR